MLSSKDPTFGPNFNHFSLFSHNELDPCYDFFLLKTKTVTESLFILLKRPSVYDNNSRNLLTCNPNRGTNMAHVSPCAMTRNLKFLATFDRM